MDSYTTKELLLASLIHISKSIETLTISIEVKKWSPETLIKNVSIM